MDYDSNDYDEYLNRSFKIRENFVSDKFRPNYHFLPPEGNWNDINGCIFWKGRYHIGYLQKIRNGPNIRDFSSWQHISSRDLLHWKYHKSSLNEPLLGTKGNYFNSGDIMRGMDIPTIITNMPSKGICIYQSFDKNLDNWIPINENPVISINDGIKVNSDKTNEVKFNESVIFDPSGWKDGNSYYALIGNKNFRKGFEGDSTSLFKSKDLMQWEYIGPFYKSNRKWTSEEEDCACSQFFPFGNKYMLLMHTHKPFNKCQYYIGDFLDDQFIPKLNGQLSYLGSMLAGPETLIDDKGRRIFWGWVRDAIFTKKSGWNSIMTIPWHFKSSPSNELLIQPVDEIKSLRYDYINLNNFHLHKEKIIEGIESDCMEIELTIDFQKSTEFGFKLLCSYDETEVTIISYKLKEKKFVIDFNRSSIENIYYPCGNNLVLKKGDLYQNIPYDKINSKIFNFRIFVDKSIIEIFVDNKICFVQRVYPVKNDSKLFKIFTLNDAIKIINLKKWEIDSTNPW